MLFYSPFTTFSCKCQCPAIGISFPFHPISHQTATSESFHLLIFKRASLENEHKCISWLLFFLFSSSISHFTASIILLTSTPSLSHGHHLFHVFHIFRIISIKPLSTVASLPLMTISYGEAWDIGSPCYLPSAPTNSPSLRLIMDQQQKDEMS